MRVKEGWVLLFIFFSLLVPTIVVIVGEVTKNSSYSHISKYTLSTTPAPLRFDVIGDFGQLHSENLTDNQEPVISVAQAMQAQALQRSISFIIAVGDNSYPYAYSDFDQNIYKLMYDDFDIPGLKAKPWFLVLGNHDWEKNPEYEINANELYPMWNMPSHYYNFSLSIDRGYKVGFTFVDANIFLGSGSANASNEQYAWLTTVLQDQAEDPKTLWKIVSFHQPLWSPGFLHGDNEGLKTLLYGLFVQYQVDVLLTGHEHIMAHLASTTPGGKPQPLTPLPSGPFYCTYEEFAPFGEQTIWVQGEALHEVLQGAGGKELYETCTNKTTAMADLLYGYSQYGFCEVYVDSNVMEVRYFSWNETQPVYSFGIVSNIP